MGIERERNIGDHDLPHDEAYHGHDANIEGLFIMRHQVAKELAVDVFDCPITLCFQDEFVGENEQLR